MLAVLLAGCGPRFVVDEVGGARHLSAQVTSRIDGTASAKFDVADGDTALMVTAQADGGNQVHVRSLIDPTGVQVFDAFEWNDSPNSKTNGGFVADLVSLNWPVQIGDQGLFPGRWTIDLGVVDQNQAYVAAPIALDVLLKQDIQVGSGSIDVSIVYTGDLQGDKDLTSAVDQAKDIWARLYQKMGIDITFQTYAYKNGDLQPPAVGDDGYIDIASETAPRSINLVISPQIQGYDQIFGIAGDIPGPLVPSPRSAVQVSALLAAGVDGKFSSEEIRLLAETMAHESGHYLGLFHPVESTWDAWDNLPDTAECADKRSCETDLGDNLMFPYPVCGVSACTPQDQLTHEQAGVANRNVSVQ